jgi:uncharacterized membrane protein
VDARVLVLTLHIFAGAVWIGSSFYSSVAYPRHASNRTLGDTYRVEEKLTRNFIGAAMAVVLVTGVSLVLMSTLFGFVDLFVIIGIAAIFVRVGLESGLFLPAIKRTVTGETNRKRSVEPLMRWSALFDVALFGFVMWAMVVKLGA